MSAEATQPQIEIVDAPEHQAFRLTVDGAPAGELVYRLSAGDPQPVDLTHTEVNEAYAGQGLAGALVRGALQQLRARSPRVRVTASCPYAAHWIGRHREEFSDLID